MKKLISLFLLTIIYTNTFSQFVTTRRINTSVDKIYHKQTGKQLSEKEINEIIQEYPQTSFDLAINKYGEIDHYEYDPNKIKSGTNKDISARPKSGEAFPPFSMKSIENKILDSEKISGKNILLHFQLDFNKPFFFDQALKDANELINELPNKAELISIVLSNGSKKDILKEIDTSIYNMDFVSDGQNFSLKYRVLNYPSFILINKKGQLVSYYDADELDKVKAYLLKTQ
jgi:hypothetical protein